VPEPYEVRVPVDPVEMLETLHDAPDRVYVWIARQDATDDQIASITESIGQREPKALHVVCRDIAEIRKLSPEDIRKYLTRSSSGQRRADGSNRARHQGRRRRALNGAGTPQALDLSQSIFYNPGRGVPRYEDLYTIRRFARSHTVSIPMTAIKGQVTTTEWSVVPTVDKPTASTSPPATL